MNVQPSKQESSAPREEPPPFLKTWRRVYLSVISWLVFLIVVFYLFSRVFSP
jgi:hypothetical protein